MGYRVAWSRPDLFPGYQRLSPVCPGKAFFIVAVPGRFCPRSCYSPCMHGPPGLQSRGRLCPTPAVDVGGSPWRSGAGFVL